jgi:hypothetical protein
MLDDINRPEKESYGSAPIDRSGDLGLLTLLYETDEGASRLVGCMEAAGRYAPSTLPHAPRVHFASLTAPYLPLVASGTRSVFPTVFPSSPSWPGSSGPSSWRR